MEEVQQVGNKLKDIIIDAMSMNEKVDAIYKIILTGRCGTYNYPIGYQQEQTLESARTGIQVGEDQMCQFLVNPRIMR